MQIDWWTLALQTINFLIVVWLLSRFLYRPIRKVIEDREAADRAASEAARKATEDAAETRRTFEARLAQLDRDRQAQEAALHHDLEEKRARGLEEARAEAAALVEEARKQGETETRAALARLKDQILALATDLARRSLAGTAGETSGPAQVAAHLDALSGRDLDMLKAEVAQGASPITVTSAAMLSDAARAAWGDMLTARFGPGLRILFTEDADLLAGVEVHFPHAVLRFSAADRLARAAEALETEA